VAVSEFVEVDEITPEATSIAATEREQLVLEVSRFEVDRAEYAVDVAIAKGLPIREILDYFAIVRRAWSEANRGLWLYRRLVDKPAGLKPNEGWRRFDDPRLAQILLAVPKQKCQASGTTREEGVLLEAPAAAPPPNPQQAQAEREAVAAKVKELARKLKHPP
jgi:hypothetical protein